MPFKGLLTSSFCSLAVLACGCAQPSAIQIASNSDSANTQAVSVPKTAAVDLPEDFEARLSSQWSQAIGSARKHFLQGENDLALNELEFAEAIRTNSATRELRSQIADDQYQREAIRRGTDAIVDGYIDEAIRCFEKANSVVPTQETEDLLRRAKCRAFVQSAMTQVVRGNRSRATELLGEALWYHESADARQLLNEISQRAASMPDK